MTHGSGLGASRWAGIALLGALIGGCGDSTVFNAGAGGQAPHEGGGGTAGGTASGGSSSSSSTSGAGGAPEGGGGEGGGGEGGGGGTVGPHSIGGTVQGLFGSGLVLQNNGGDALPIAANGPFAFVSPVETGNGYAVTVAAEPASPAQTCTVDDGQGTVGKSDVTDVLVDCQLVDTDGDTIPDLADPFPNDGNIPKPALANMVYPHTASQLYTMDVNTHAIAFVGSFNGSGYSGSMTDMAIDQFGVLYGVTFTDLYTCDAMTAQCWKLAPLPQSFNGLTMVPPGTIDPMLDTLVAIANAGTWYKVKLTGNGQATLTNIGGYGGGYTSSGDAFSIQGVGTFASVDKAAQQNDVIISVNPQNGSFIAEVGPVPGYSSLYGLAGWLGTVYGFDDSGAVIEIDIKTGQPTVIAKTNHSWWGAAVSTRAPGT